MKLRLKGNSLRLRLTRGEVERLREAGRVEETTSFGSDGTLVYAVELVVGADAPRARLAGAGVTVQLPRAEALRWARSEEVGIYGPEEGPSAYLSLRVEKDFRCLTPRPGGEDDDAFPHPDETC